MTTIAPILRFLAVLACLWLAVGCQDKDKEEALVEAAEAKILLAKVKTDLARAKSQIADLEQDLEAIKETHNELQTQVEQLAGERDTAIAVAEEALVRIKDLTARSNEQVESVVMLQDEIEQLKAVIESQRTTVAEQQAAIEELQKIIEQQEGVTEEQQENIEEQERPLRLLRSSERRSEANSTEIGQLCLTTGGN